MQRYTVKLKGTACLVFYTLIKGDAKHITSPPEDGKGAQKAMRRALEVAEIDPIEVDYVNAHATSTLLGSIFHKYR